MVRLSIYNKEDRLTVAKILIDNDYIVSQGKIKKTPTGKTYEYFLDVEKKGDSQNDASN
jgi:hypothetical protein